jgi:plastocyanin
LNFPRYLWALAIISILALGTLALSACGGDNDNDQPAAATTPAPTPTQPPAASPTPQVAASPTPAAEAGPTAVTMADFSYAPATISARVGQQVALNVTNAGALPHTFTIDNVVDSGTISAGQNRTVQFTPTQAGSLTFYCTIHGRATMSGTVNVTAGGAQSQPQESQPASGTGTGGTTSSDPYGSDSYGGY